MPTPAVEVDEHESILGVDDQNIIETEVFNLRVLLFFSFFLLRLLRPLLLLSSIPIFGDQATLSSVLQVNVWQLSQSKTKSKIDKPGSLRWSLSRGIIDETTTRTE